LGLALCVLPWSRIPLCRNRLPLAGAAMLLGGGAAFFVEQPVGSPLLLLAPNWILWMTAIGACVRMFRLRQRKSRALAGYPASG
jgi:hypothetical protein